jgi:hypothetical protein
LTVECGSGKSHLEQSVMDAFSLKEAL